ncbi:MAG: polar amino acid transport system substrate-binding protein [Rhodospirillaceae bacterium]|jgi:polar amino acid transport system substrate-binding protein|nr:polar amino acid transport system substrate-binding protein [Rhodospirillaceae bacterium]
MVRSKLLFAVAVVLGSSAMILGTGPAAQAADPLKCEPDKLATKYPGLAGKKIIIGQDGESPPYSFRDPKDFNTIIGADADMVRAAFKCIGGQFEFKLGGWSGLLPAVIAGQADVMWDNLYFTTERAKQVDYVVYMIAGTGALVKKGNPKKITGMDGTCGLTATAGLGTVEEAAFRDQSEKCKAAGKAAINIMTYPDIPAGTRLIQNDRADILLSDLAMVDQLSANNPTAFERGFKVISDFKIGVAMKKGNEDLLKALFDALTVLQADGTQKKIYEQYKLDPALILPIAIQR